MAEEIHRMTSEGVKKLEDELQDLKINRRQEVAQKLKEARAQGDLSENAEYDAAKEEKQEIEDRIEELEELLKHVEVISEEELNSGKVNLGCKVKVHDKEFDEDDVYYIVGTSEVDSLANKISDKSPVGKALMGHKAGDTVSVTTPGGAIELEILDVSRTQAGEM